MSILDQVAAPVERRLPTNSLERALTFIEVIAWRTKGLTNSELCHEFRVSSSTCSYILNRLELYGFVHRDKDSGRYQIGSSGALRPPAGRFGRLPHVTGSANPGVEGAGTGCGWCTARRARPDYRSCTGGDPCADETGDWL